MKNALTNILPHNPLTQKGLIDEVKKLKGKDNNGEQGYEHSHADFQPQDGRIVLYKENGTDLRNQNHMNNPGHSQSY